MLDNVGWLPNRIGLDYGAVLEKKPAFAAFVNYPEGYKFFSLPNIGPAEEVLTRTADHLTQAYADASLVDNPAGIDAVLQAIQDDINGILAREGLGG
jgi:multiple sugar transport system substrate-binding protein